ncbi:hypothetical protein BDP27DRAFT_488328 [Rhodocollybia butyracea]|uniref:DUF6589 domain-containing protein n=1 Tax=Rhodocollybia butyracea TaxID=206335 RepID=A0A9P5QAJ8_9AGAR|nr:hypothetical protein BDP27DRAFT_488328 [Rhodocollybia butyracea]
MLGRSGYKEGSPWQAPKKDASSADVGVALPKTKKKSGKGKSESDKTPFIGDETLARSTRLIYDGLLFRLAKNATHHGDAGCLWECLKVRLKQK